ncbi:MAG: hypothetical protein LBF57_02220 [Holosporaceae bacterium]|jgi:hypothetical protein|nr:hypothetical protein [Holosporaceae bacterium]
MRIFALLYSFIFATLSGESNLDKFHDFMVGGMCPPKNSENSSEDSALIIKRIQEVDNSLQKSFASLSESTSTLVKMNQSLENSTKNEEEIPEENQEEDL